MIRASKLSGTYVIDKEGSNRCGNYHTLREDGNKIPPEMNELRKNESAGCGKKAALLVEPRGGEAEGRSGMTRRTLLRCIRLPFARNRPAKPRCLRGGRKLSGEAWRARQSRRGSMGGRRISVAARFALLWLDVGLRGRLSSGEGLL
jgi:hypothetical protein